MFATKGPNKAQSLSSARLVFSVNGLVAMRSVIFLLQTICETFSLCLVDKLCRLISFLWAIILVLHTFTMCVFNATLY